jgi:hypothetical protein
MPSEAFLSPPYLGQKETKHNGYCGAKAKIVVTNWHSVLAGMSRKKQEMPGLWAISLGSSRFGGISEGQC